MAHILVYLTHCQNPIKPNQIYSWNLVKTSQNQKFKFKQNITSHSMFFKKRFWSVLEFWYNGYNTTLTIWEKKRWWGGMVKRLKNNQKPFVYLFKCHWHALMVEELHKCGFLLPKFLLYFFKKITW
jgi:hypothetical protein